MALIFLLYNELFGILEASTFSKYEAMAAVYHFGVAKVEENPPPPKITPISLVDSEVI